MALGIMSNLIAKIVDWWRATKIRSPVLPDEADLSKDFSHVPSGFEHFVQILNDEQTPMDGVVRVLTRSMNIGDKAAIEMMLRIHREGGILLGGMKSREEAALKSQEMIALARSIPGNLRIKHISLSRDA